VAIDMHGVRVDEAGRGCGAVMLHFDRAPFDSWRERFVALRDIRPSLLGTIAVHRA
jgi:hypothetical protein